MKVFDKYLGEEIEMDPPVWPFQKLVHRATKECGCVDSCRCHEGFEPRLVKNTIYHAIRKIGLWPKAGPARTAFRQRLMGSDCPQSKATDLSWRLLEDMLFWTEGEAGFDLAVIDAELDAMLAYGEEREYPDQPSEADVASTLAEIRTVFGGEYPTSRLPTTVVHFYKRLGMWDLAARLLERMDPDRGEIEDHSTSNAWRVLAFALSHWSTVAEIRDFLRERVKGGTAVVKR